MQGSKNLNFSMLEHIGTMTPFDLPHLILLAKPGVPLSTIHATIFATATQAAVDLQRQILVGGGKQLLASQHLPRWAPPLLAQNYVGTPQKGSNGRTIWS